MKRRYAIAAIAMVVSWTSPAMTMSPSDLSHIHGIAFDPLGSGDILLATHHGVYRATPDGTVFPQSSDRNDYMGFTPDWGDSGRLVASGHPTDGGNLGVIVSKDGGATWTRLSSGAGDLVDFHAMTVSRADPKTMYGLHGGIQVSRDAGVTWAVVGAGVEGTIDLAASPTAPDLLYAGTRSGLMVSSDAGKTWSLIGPSNVPTSMVEATSDGSIYVFFAGVGLFKWSASGERWNELAKDFGGSVILHLAADPSDAARLVAVTEASAIIESIDGGKTWETFGP